MCARTSPRGVSRFKESFPSISEGIHDAARRRLTFQMFSGGRGRSTVATQALGKSRIFFQTSFGSRIRGEDPPAIGFIACETRIHESLSFPIFLLKFLPSSRSCIRNLYIFVCVCVCIFPRIFSNLFFFFSQRSRL